MMVVLRIAVAVNFALLFVGSVSQETGRNINGVDDITSCSVDQGCFSLKY